MPSPGAFSSHFCLGGWDAGTDGTGIADLGSVDVPWARLQRNQKERTCVFRNVCYHAGKHHAGKGADLGWVYFAQRDEFRMSKRVRAGVDVWARGDFARMGDVSEDHSFALRHAAIPDGAEWLPTAVHDRPRRLRPRQPSSRQLHGHHNPWQRRGSLKAS